MIIWSINFFKIGSITFEDLKFHDFWRCVFKKSYSFLCNEEHGCIIYMMYDQGVIKEYKNLEHNSKLGVKMQNLG
jgi:hypothetical protein